MGRRIKTLDAYLEHSKNKDRLKAEPTAKTSHTQESLFTWTGHPFTDAGLVALLLLSGKEKPDEITEEDVKSAIEFVSSLYAKKEWSSGYIHAMMMPNSGILMANPSMAKKRTPSAIAKNLSILLSESEDPTASICEICGRRHVRAKPVYRSDFPLVGTGGVPNYFPSGKEGANICTYCLFLVQMMPLVAYRLPKILIIHTYPYELMLEFHREALEDVKKSELASTARNFKRPENFLFKKLVEIGRKLESGELENVSITMYYFVNNNQGQELEIIYIPNPVLRFVSYAAVTDRDGWKRIVSMGWHRGCLKKYSKKPDEIERSCSNDVYSKLLSGESILPYFIDRKNRRTNTKWSLLAFYSLEVLGLDKDALDLVRNIADKVVETIEKLPDNKLARRVRELERAERLYQFESFFIKVEKDRLEHGIKGPLMSFDEFARILTTYGEDLNISWKTVKNLILFRIYEKLHDRLMKASEELESLEEEEFEEGGVEE